MGKTNYSFRNRLYEALKSSPLAAEITGKVCRGYRDTGSESEDIVFYDFGADNASIQGSFVVLNIYVPDIHNGTEWREDADRCELLAQMAWDFLDELHLGDYYVEIKEQTSFAVEDENVKQHGIRFNLNVKQF